MMNRYDEDLFDNPFFAALQTSHVKLYEQATVSRSILCIPRYSRVVKLKVSKADVEDHILSPQTQSDTDFLTVSGKELKIEDGSIKLSSSFGKERKVSILFEETFYNNNDESYRVLCVSDLFNKLETDEEDEKETTVIKRPTSYEECVELLWGHQGGTKLEEQFKKAVFSYCRAYDKIEWENLRSVVDAASAQFTKSMQIILKDPTFKKAARHSQSYLDNLKIAVETYLMNGIHRQLFRAITACTSTDDADLNKMTRNLVEICLTDMGVRSEFNDNIPSARKELSSLNRFSTPLGRLFCLKRAITALSRPLRHSSKKGESIAMTTDDLLPILIYLIIKTDIPNWMANLVYMKDFHFAKTSADDEFGFYMATMEGSLEQIRSGRVKEEALQADKAKHFTWFASDSSHASAVSRQKSSSLSVTVKFFECVRNGDESTLTSMLKKFNQGSDDVFLKLCHPLCSCEKCDKLLLQSKKNSNLVTPYTRDDRGYTALHIAALYGQAQLIDILMQHGAIVDAADYLGLTPLHLASQKGFQNIVLLLVHFGADLTMADNDGNTPLHLSAANGHDDCVKALVFLDIAKLKLDVNAQNDMGDTALHLAAKWGYETIVYLLLENDAHSTIRNRKKQTPLSLAQSSKVQRLLQKAAEVPVLLRARNKSNDNIYHHVDSPMSRKTGSVPTTPDISSPSTPIVESLDQVDSHQQELLFKAVTQGDLPLVCYYLGWVNSSEEEEDLTEQEGLSEPNDSQLCHPLCQCSKCRPIQKMSTGRNGLHVNCQNKSGFTPLHVAILNSHVHLVHLFLKKKANIDIQNKKKITPLHLACYIRNTEVAYLLLENGSKVHLRDGSGDTPLHLCCAKGCMDIAIKLLQNGAKPYVNMQNFEGNTPLHVAINTGRLNMVEELMTIGAKCHIQNKKCLTPLQFAQTDEMRQFLKRYASMSSAEANPPQTISEDVHQIKTKELFAAFEEKDLQKLQDLVASIRSFDKKKNLRRTLTRDDSMPNLSRISISHLIESFDARSLKHIKFNKKSLSLENFDSVGSSKEKDISREVWSLDSLSEDLVACQEQRHSSSSIDDIFQAMCSVGPSRKDVLEQSVHSQTSNDHPRNIAMPFSNSTLECVSDEHSELTDDVFQSTRPALHALETDEMKNTEYGESYLKDDKSLNLAHCFIDKNTEKSGEIVAVLLDSNKMAQRSHSQSTEEPCS